MRAATRQVRRELNALSGHFDAGDLSEALALLGWMEDRHFTFLGFREYRCARPQGPGSAAAGRGHGPWDPAPRPPPADQQQPLASDIRRQSRSRDIVLVTKANLVSTVHRSGHLDYVGIKHFDAKGRLIGEKRFLGLWTSSAYSSNPREIPVLRHKVAQVVEHFALAPDSHDGKALMHILESFPRDELFQANVAELIRTRHRRVRPAGAAAGAPAAAARCLSPVLFLPGVRAAREIQHPGPPAHRERHPRSVFRDRMESQVQIAESNLARIHIVARTRRANARIDADALERRIAARRALVAGRLQGGAAGAPRRSLRPAAVREICAARFPPPTPRIFSGDAAALDVSFLEAVEKEPARLHLDIYRPEPRRKDKFFLKIFRIHRMPFPFPTFCPCWRTWGSR